MKSLPFKYADSTAHYMRYPKLWLACNSVRLENGLVEIQDHTLVRIGASAFDTPESTRIAFLNLAALAKTYHSIRCDAEVKKLFLALRDEPTLHSMSHILKMKIKAIMEFMG